MSEERSERRAPRAHVHAVPLRVPALAPSVPPRGNAVTRWLGRVVLRALDWRIEGAMPDRPRFVIIVAPHTSNWDFLVAMGALFALGFRASWLGKHTLFRAPFARLLRWLGGIPVDRSRPHGVVEQTVEEFRRHAGFVLALTPSGTRRRGSPWKTGFYHIAHAADAPVVPVAFDWGRRVVRIDPPFETTGELEGDLAMLKAHFEGVRGRYSD